MRNIDSKGRALTMLVPLLIVTSCTPALDLQPHDDQYEVCGRRASTAARSVHPGVVGKIRQIADETQVDGPVRLTVVDPHGDLRKLYFGSLYTRAGPSEQRLAAYRAIASSKTGDCVEASGSVMSDGMLWVETFVDFDASEASR